MEDVTRERIEWAKDILGIGDVVTYNEVVQQWRRLVKKLHPDVGGDDKKIRDVNEAKNIILRFIRNCPCSLEAKDGSDWWDRRFGKLWKEK